MGGVPCYSSEYQEENDKTNIQKALEWFTPQVIERTSLNICLNQDNMPNEMSTCSKLIYYNIMRMSAYHLVCKSSTFLNKLPREMVEHIKSYFHVVPLKYSLFKRIWYFEYIKQLNIIKREDEFDIDYYDPCCDDYRWAYLRLKQINHIINTLTDEL